MITHLAIGLLGAGIFLRIVGKEKNRRHRHLLLRVAEQEKRLGEPAAENQQQTASSDDAGGPDGAEAAAPFEAQPVGRAA